MLGLMTEPTNIVDVIVRGGVAYLDSISDGELNKRIQKATSFKPAGLEYTIAYKRRKSDPDYDGRVKLVKNSKCPAGLLPRIKEIIEHSGYQVNVRIADDEAPKPSIETRLDDIQERFYQEAAATMALIHDRGIVRAPTGSGKTAIGARIIHARKQRAIVVVPTIDLLKQYKGFLEEHLRVLDGVEARDDFGTTNMYQRFEPIGQLGDGVVQPQSVTVATIRTMAKVLNIAYESYAFGEYDDSDDTDVNPRELQEWVESIGTLIIDEAHILGAEVVYGVTNRIPARCKIGMSASPWRDDGADLMIEAATGEVVYRIDPAELVESGFLVPPIIQVVPTHTWWRPAAWGRVCKRCGRQVLTYAERECSCGCSEFKSQWQECYKAEIVENVVRNAKIAEKVRDIDCPTLVLVKQIKHGRALAELIPDSIFLSGSNDGDTREEAFDGMRAGTIKVIIATSIADMGMDLPNLQALVLAGGGKSSTRHLQRIGRVVRPYPGKSAGLVVDFDDSHVHSWFVRHAKARREIELAEWGDCAVWC